MLIEALLPSGFVRVAAKPAIGKGCVARCRKGELPGGNDPRSEIRAVLLFGYYSGANPPPTVLQKFDCNIVPSLCSTTISEEPALF
jgi:hypothetical protein